MTSTHTLKFACPDKPGIVSRITTSLLRIGGNILDAQQFDDTLSGQFFCRIEFEVPNGVAATEVHANLTESLTPLAAQWSVAAESEHTRVLIMASKDDHCLVDLLYRWRSGDLPMDVVGIVSNHPEETYANLDLSGIPFHHLPVTKETKPDQEAKLIGLIEEYNVQLVVLARYMQILSDELSTYLHGRCINIHHSFLPGFKGAKPYHQAHARGVKLIGATAHYVTGDLDEGPIIVQDVEPISHRDTPDRLVRKGRDIERRVLARAVSHHVNGRVLVHGKTTVVFPE
ncbi:formyltetrahydrofolate deformylase [Rhodococcus sp. (in: high G+C Gram-positive bacteria)]|uniref:formyltetrahydrofolate deformylase n=1 Tax=Rhodococcus sp. TaxID=1831 RepID=UPI00257A8C28|nr:formyltetrahydrofolate deformylase [Rhodococcus sp. (in: high G+C Gram-positive bacteria)]MBQ9054200.1 formyltetrahydrofolate deformylase [Rhodococcus sp. (in: high G+C Gram-positive bacteria)]